MSVLEFAHEDANQAAFAKSVATGKVPGAAARSASEPPPGRKKKKGERLQDDPAWAPGAAFAAWAPGAPFVKGAKSKGGKGKTKGKAKGPETGCFNCGGDHFARECPQGPAKGKSKGKGKGKDKDGKGKGGQGGYKGGYKEWPAAFANEDKGDAKGTRKGERSAEQKKLLGCFHFRSGTCNRGTECAYSHDDAAIKRLPPPGEKGAWGKGASAAQKEPAAEPPPPASKPGAKAKGATAAVITAATMCGVTPTVQGETGVAACGPPKSKTMRPDRGNFLVGLKNWGLRTSKRIAGAFAIGSGILAPQLGMHELDYINDSGAGRPILSKKKG